MIWCAHSSPSAQGTFNYVHSVYITFVQVVGFANVMARKIIIFAIILRIIFLLSNEQPLDFLLAKVLFSLSFP